MKRLIVIGFLLASAALGGQGTAPSTVFTEVGIDQNLNAQIPLELQFRDERGRTVTLNEYFHGKPVVLSLVYYRCPMLCTQVLNGMVETFRIVRFTAGREFTVVTVSIDPTETSDLAAGKKAQYVKQYDRPGVEEGWHFLTGDQAAISKLAKTVGLRRREKSPGTSTASSTRRTI
jgi:protein SCO1/2